MDEQLPRSACSLKKCVCFVLLTGDREACGGLAVSRHEGHLSRVPRLAVFDGEGVLPAACRPRRSRESWLQPLTVAGPVGVGARVLQLHAEDDRVADRYHCPSGQLLGNVALQNIRKKGHLNTKLDMRLYVY